MKVDARVREVLVYGEKDETVGTLLAMDIAGDFSSVDEIRDLCRGCLPAYQMPVKLIWLLNCLKMDPEKLFGGSANDGI